MDPPFRPMGGRMHFDPGTFGTMENRPGRQRNAPEGLGLARQGGQMPGMLSDDDVRQAQA